MRILITGATGLIGGEIIRLCRKKGIQVSILTTSRNKAGSQKEITAYYWNPSTGEIDPKCFDGVEHIINLAGATVSKRWTSAYKKKIVNSRVQSLQLLHQSLSQHAHQVKSLVTASGISIYPHSLTTLYEEDETAVDASFLGQTVMAWEQAADELLKNNIRVAKLRIGIVLSERGGALPQMVMPIKAFMGSRLGTGEQWQSWIHLTDLAALFLFAIENELEGVYNAVAPNPVTNCKLTKAIAGVFNKPLVMPAVPRWLVKAMLGEMGALPFFSQRVSSKKIEEEGYLFQYSSITPALENLLKEKGQSETD